MRDQLRAIALLIGTAFRADARRAALVLVLAPAVGAGWVINGLAIGRATDAAIRHDPRAALAAVTLLAVAAVVTFSAGAFVSSLRIDLQQRVGLLLDQRLMAMAGGLPTLTHHENPQYLDQMELLRANRGQLGGAFGALVENLRAVFGLAVTVVVLATIHPALLFLPLFALPAVFASQLGNRLIGRTQQDTAEAERLRRSLAELACSPEAAREIRVYRLAADLTRRHNALQDTIIRARDRADTRAALWSGGGWLVFATGYLGAVALSLGSVSRSDGTAGDVALTVVLGAQLLGAVSGTVGLSGWLQQALRAAGYFLWLADHAAQAEIAPAAGTAGADNGDAGLVLDHVWFTYPGTDRPILRDVSLRVPAGATVAIVGENGAGKTTLAKLLCRMYVPTSGSISYAGADIATMDVEVWRRELTACFQDFQRFELTLADAVGIGDLPRLGSRHAVAAALARGGGEDLPPLLPDGLDTQLGATLAGGVDLSTGQWQKVAMSRAMMRQTPRLLILDEPTASLDAASEHALFARYTQAAHRGTRQPITVLVTHRFATVRMADLIVVLADGTVREVGSHEELLTRNDLYADLYALSTRGLVTTPPPIP